MTAFKAFTIPFFRAEPFSRRLPIVSNTATFLTTLLICLFALSPNVLQADPGSVQDGMEVNINYRLRLKDGSLVSKSEPGAPLSYIQGTHQIVPGLEKALQGMHVGEKKSVIVPAAEGYGAFQAGKLVEVQKSELRGNLTPGAFVEGTRPSGELIRARVIEVREKTAILDFNHPMAGKDLYYDVEIVALKPAAALN